MSGRVQGPGRTVTRVRLGREGRHPASLPGTPNGPVGQLISQSGPPWAGRPGVSAHGPPFCFANRKLPRGGKANSVSLGSAVSLAEINVSRGRRSPGSVGGAAGMNAEWGQGPPSTPESWGPGGAAGWGSLAYAPLSPLHSPPSRSQLTPPLLAQRGHLLGSLRRPPIP